MSKLHMKQVKLVISLLDKPKWYNETITHPNWPLIKRNLPKPGEWIARNPEPKLEATPTDYLRNRLVGEMFIERPKRNFLIGVTTL